MAEKQEVLSRKDIIKIGAEVAGVGYKRMRDATKAMLDAVGDAVAQGKDVHFVGFGTFSAKYRPSRLQVTPNTGEKKQLEDDLLPKFKPGKAFKQKVSSATALKKKLAAAYTPKTPKHVQPK